jgi:hypothetical protein
VNIYIICAVRGASNQRIVEIRRYVDQLRNLGHNVHFPPDDAPQDDRIGIDICDVHLDAMKKADEVHVFWDVESRGSHFDLGMAFALGGKLKSISCERPDGNEKSYWKVIKVLERRASHPWQFERSR